MKILFFLTVLSLIGLTTTAQSYDYYSNYSYKSAKGAYHDDLEFIIHGGVLLSDLRYGESTAFDLGIDYTPYESDDDMFSPVFRRILS